MNQEKEIRTRLGKDEVKRRAILEEFIQILADASADNNDPKTLSNVRAFLDRHPDLGVMLDALGNNTRQRIIASLASPPVREVILAQCATLQRDLGHAEASPLERMLIDHVVTCWLRYEDVNHRYQNQMENQQTFASGEFWEKRLSAAHRRYLRAIKTLAEVRRLAARTPAVLQINVAGQQINQVRG